MNEYPVFVLYEGKLLNAAQIKWASMKDRGHPDEQLYVEFVTGGWCTWPDNPDATLDGLTDALSKVVQ